MSLKVNNQILRHWELWLCKQIVSQLIFHFMALET